MYSISFCRDIWVMPDCFNYSPTPVLLAVWQEMDEFLQRCNNSLELAPPDFSEDF